MFWAKNSPSVPTMLRGWSWRSPIWNAGFSVRCDDGLPADGVDPSVAVPAGALPTVELALVPAVVTADGELGAVSRPTVAPVVASVDEPGEEPVEAPVVGEVAGLAVVGRAEVDALVPEAPVDAVSGVTVPEPVGDVPTG